MSGWSTWYWPCATKTASASSTKKQKRKSLLYCVRLDYQHGRPCWRMQQSLQGAEWSQGEDKPSRARMHPNRARTPPAGRGQAIAPTMDGSGFQRCSMAFPGRGQAIAPTMDAISFYDMKCRREPL